MNITSLTQSCGQVPPKKKTPLNFDSMSNIQWVTTPDGYNYGKHSSDSSSSTEQQQQQRPETDKTQQVYDSIVKIHTTYSYPNFTMPWQRAHQYKSTSSGFVTSIPGIGLRIVTNAHSVDYASTIRVQRRGKERRYDAVMEALGNECDLALLRVDDEAFYIEGEVPLEFGPLPNLQDKVQVIGYPTGGASMSFTSGIVSRIDQFTYSQAGQKLLVIQIDAAINAGNSGGPVLNEAWEVVGVAFQTLNNSENIGYVIPVNVVSHFLEDVRRWKDGEGESGGGGSVYVGGFCELGIASQSLENRALRKSLGLTVEDDNSSCSSSSQKEPHSGVMVRKVQPTSNAAVGDFIRPRDVITSIDDIPISNDGKIPFRHGERVPYKCYIQTKFPGDTVKVSLLRRPDGEGDDAIPTEIIADVPVSIDLPPIPDHHNNCLPPYLIVSGLVFTELSTPLLDEWRSWNWDLSHLSVESSKYLKHKDDKIVVLVQVLAHKENLGYEDYKAMHLVEVDGTKVKNLKNFKSLLEEGEGEFVRFKFAPHGGMVVLERAIMEEVTKEVCHSEGIKATFHFPSVDGSNDSGDDNIHDNTNGDEELNKGKTEEGESNCVTDEDDEDGKGNGDCNTGEEEKKGNEEVMPTVSSDSADNTQ